MFDVGLEECLGAGVVEGLYVDGDIFLDILKREDEATTRSVSSPMSSLHLEILFEAFSSHETDSLMDLPSYNLLVWSNIILIARPLLL